MQILHPTPLIATSEEGVYELETDNTTLEGFVTCSRFAQMYKVKRREPSGERAALFFGSVLHSALEPRKLGEPDYLRLGAERIIAAYDSHPVAYDEWRNADRALRTLAGYEKEYPLADEPFTILPGTVEMPFRLYIGECPVDDYLWTRNGPVFVKKLVLYWTGRIDALINEGGPLYVLDHKTSSVLGPSYFDDFQLAQQMIGYTWAARELGYPVVGLRLDVIVNRKPSKTGKELEFHRMPYWYDDFHIAEWKEDIYALITDFIEHWLRGYFPKGTKWCHGKYGACSYWDVCTKASVEGREQELMSDAFVDVTWSPLHERAI